MGCGGWFVISFGFGLGGLSALGFGFRFLCFGTKCGELSRNGIGEGG